MKLSIMTLSAFALSASMATAAAFSEPPDFGDFFSPTNAGLLSLGSYTMTGGLSTTCVEDVNSTFANCSSGDWMDSLLISLAAGTELDNVQLTISNFTLTGTMESDSLGLGHLGWFIFDADGVYAVSAGDALRWSQLNFVADSATVTSPYYLQGTGDISFDYNLAFDVVQTAAVPLPAGGLLLLSGLGLAGWLGRRRSV
ncbi:MAG: hypothetical protein KDA67_14410 [Rhodobacteraceae bacterium]|nr:hypothetical protein [Paracoccaceae bacterium]